MMAGTFGSAAMNIYCFVEELENNSEAQYVVNWPEKYVGEFDILYC